MARTQIPISLTSTAATAQPSQTTADATNNHYVAAADWISGDLLIEIVSTDGSSRTVTVVANPDLSVDGLTVSNRTLTIPAGTTQYFSGFRPRSHKQAVDANRLYLNPSVSTTLKFRAYRVPTTT